MQVTGSGGSDVRRRVLLLDDDRPYLRSADRALRQDFDVVTEFDPRIALERVREERVDIIVSDFQMPQMDGLRFLTQARDERPECRRILNSAYEDAVFEKAVEVSLIETVLSKSHGIAGLTDYLRKPRGYGALGTSAEAPRAKPLVEMSRFLAVTAGEPATTIQLIDLFLGDTDERVAEIESSLVNGDHDRLARQLHMLLGSCMTVGAAALAASAQRLSDERDTESAPQRLVELQRDFERTRVALLRLRSEAEQVR